MEISIEQTALQDLDQIFALYDDAIAYQKTVGNNHWLGFETAFIENEIAGRKHYKIIADGQIVATFGIALADPAFWKDSDTAAAVYVHRVATSRSFRGHNVFKYIIDWAKKFSRDNDLTYIRLDTGDGNDRLINYYVKNGFTFVGTTTVDWQPGMPAHYKDGVFALLEMTV